MAEPMEKGHNLKLIKAGGLRGGWGCFLFKLLPQKQE